MTLPVTMLAGDRPSGADFTAILATLNKRFTSAQLLTGSASSVTFTIPATLRRVEVHWSARGDNATNTIDVRMQINGNAAASYLAEILQGTGAAASAAANPGAGTSAQVGLMTAASAGANIHGSGDIWISGWNAPHDSGVGLQWTWSDTAQAGASFHQSGGGVYVQTGPYTSLTLLPGAGNFVAGSQFIVEGWYP